MITLSSAAGNKPLFTSLLNAYLAELSFYNPNIRMGCDGIYEPGLIDELLDSEHETYLIFEGASPCGFVSVGKGNVGMARRNISEMYVVPAKRRGGAGTRALDLVFKKHKGKYSLHFLKSDQNAARFWLTQMRSRGLSYAIGSDCRAACYLIFNV